jgi:hypothetical protein
VTVSRAAPRPATAESAAALIIKGLGGQHLAGFLPGADNRAAISHAVTSQHGWSERDGTWGQVVPEGIGRWPGVSHRGPPAEAVEFVSWSEVLDIVSSGCADGRRQAYEAAYAAFGEWADATAWVPGEGTEARRIREAEIDPALYSRAHDGIHETTAEIIRHGCRALIVQQTLF